MIKYLFFLLPTVVTAQPLSDQLSAYLQKLPATVQVSVAVESLTGTSSTAFFYRADERTPSASLIKLPVMVEAMEWVKDGRINPDEIHILTDSEKAGGDGVLKTYQHRSRIAYRDIITLMITHSDNTATNILIHEIGMENINRRIRALELSQSQLNRIMMDTLAVRRGIDNYITARETNTLLRKIYQKEVATPELCDQMIDILKRNEDTATIPRLLPKNAANVPVVVAHKTGTLAYIRGDAGIVYASHPFVLSVLIQGTTTQAAEQLIGEIALICFQYFNQ